jgi:hypothetical protein
MFKVMKMNFIPAVCVVAAMLAGGCSSIPPGAERGPQGTMAFNVLVDASAPGAKIEANGNLVGDTPLTLKIFGNPNGTFHDFGSYYYIVRAYPVATNQFQQMKVFWTGRHGTQQSTIPQHIYFDMNQYAPIKTPRPPPEVHYDYPDYGPYPFFYGPAFEFDIGPGYRDWH